MLIGQNNIAAKFLQVRQKYITMNPDRKRFAECNLIQSVSFYGVSVVLQGGVSCECLKKVMYAERCIRNILNKRILFKDLLSAYQ